MKRKLLAMLLCTVIIFNNALPVLADGLEGEQTEHICGDNCAEHPELTKCEVCGEVKCICNKDDGEDNTEPSENMTEAPAVEICEICNAENCEVEHTYCETCAKYDCGEDHNAPVVTECECPDGIHVEGCGNYVAPVEPEKQYCECGVELVEGEEHTCAPVCSCGTETEEHTAECPLYVDPEVENCKICGEALAENHECAMATCEKCEQEYVVALGHIDCPKKCTCINTDGEHFPYCNLYEGEKCEICEGAHTTEKCPENFDVEAAYEYVMSLETEEEVYEFIATLTEEEYAALEEYAIEHFEPTKPLDVVSVSEVGPLLPTITFEPMPYGRMSARSLLMMAAEEPVVEPIAEETAEEENGLILNKTAEQIDGSKNYKITLETYVTGAVSISTTETIKPADIVLVLDISGSMDENIEVGNQNDTTALDTKYGAEAGFYEYYSVITWCDMRYHNGEWQYNGLGGWKSLGSSWYGTDIRTTKTKALKVAVQNFIDSVNSKTTDADGETVDHKIAIVKFAGTSSDTIGNNMYSSGSNRYNYSQIVTPLTSVNGNATDLKNTVTNLVAGGATSADYGMAHAKTILSGIDSNRDSNRVVVMFTDGQPNHGSGFNNAVANDTIGHANTIKADIADGGYGATVYTVGVFANADDTVPIANNASDMNKYMHYVSSNFKNAESLTVPNDSTYPEAGKSYYLAAGNANKIDEIFQAISDEIESGGADITLDETTVIKDTVTQYFNMPANTSDIKVYTSDYKGYDSSRNRKFEGRTPLANVEIDIDKATNAVTVSNFDFSSDENCVTDTINNGTTTYSGKKLIIEFTVTAKDEFWGGNGVPTNGADSGVYRSDGSMVEAYEVPDVNVELKDPEAIGKDFYIYYGGNKPSVDEMYKLTDEANDWTMDYVDVTADKAISNTEDATYEITVTVYPTETPEGGYGPKYATATSTITVLKPSASFDDTTIFLGNAPQVFDSYLVENSTVWSLEDGRTDEDVTMYDSNVPEIIEFGYDKEVAKFTECTTITAKPAKVKLNGVETLISEDMQIPSEFTVHVLKPNAVVTLADTTCYYGASYTAAGGSSIVNWEEDTKTAHTDIPKPEGTKPFESATLKYFSDAEKKTEFAEIVMPNKDVNVYVAAYNGADVLPTTFKTTCDVADKNCAEHDGGYYTVHPLTYSLEVTKAGWQNIDANESFIFNVTGDNSNIYSAAVDLQVVIHGNGTVKVDGLPYGIYTVTEDENWSWRYSVDTDNSKLSGTVTADGLSLTVKNIRDKDKWLDVNAYAKNTFVNATVANSGQNVSINNDRKDKKN